MRLIYSHHSRKQKQKKILGELMHEYLRLLVYKASSLKQRNTSYIVWLNFVTDMPLPF